MNLEERQITTQIPLFTKIRGTISEYNILVCQVGSEPLGRMIEDRVWGKCIAH